MKNKQNHPLNKTVLPEPLENLPNGKGKTQTKAMIIIWSFNPLYFMCIYLSGGLMVNEERTNKK